MRRAEELRPHLFVNVYNASQDEAAFSGVVGWIGAYHSGIEINGIEYSFAGVTGIYEYRRGDYGHVIKSIDLGV